MGKDIEHQTHIVGEGLTEEHYLNILDTLDHDPEHVKLLLIPLHPSDIAELFARLPLEEREILVPYISKEVMGEVLAEMSDAVRESITEMLSKRQIDQALETLESDDVADIVQNLDEDTAKRVKQTLPEEHQELLTYEEDTAGGLMQVETVALSGDWTVENTLEYMRENIDGLPEYIHAVYVTGYKGKLLGSVGLSRLVKLPLESKLSDVMWQDPVTVTPEMDQEEVARIFDKYDIFSCAVVQADGTLLGVITIDDILHVLAEEHEEDVMRAAGLEEGLDLFAPVASTTRSRFPWLFINLLTAILASTVIALFEDQIQQLVALAVLMPIVASMGGNAGIQALTVTVRGLSLKQLTFQNAFYLLKKEVLVGGFNGLLLAFILGAATVVFYDDLGLGIVICVATIMTHIFAALAGICIPLLLEKMGKDPAISAGVLLTTVTDIAGFFVFLGLAAIFLL